MSAAAMIEPVEQVVLEPQAGPQTTFLSCPADIAVYGGAAGGGKTWSLLLDPLRAVDDPHFRGVFFRRVIPNITNQGGLLDESRNVYGHFGELVTSPRIKWSFPSGASINMTHLQYAKTVEDHKGAQYSWIGFDELTEFEEGQFWYLLSRLRSPKSRHRPWMRATTNPDANSWVRRLLDWWIGPDGYVIPERSGVIRWMRRDGDAIQWFDEPTPGTLSFTFVAASLDDNARLIAADPTYRTRLEMLSTVERAKLLGGNWDASHKDGMFRHHRITADAAVYRSQLPDGIKWARYWDLADTEPHEGNPDPDWTAGVRLGLHTVGDGTETLYLWDVARDRLAGASKRAWIRSVVEADGAGILHGIEQEPGATGKEVADSYVTGLLAGYGVRADRPTGDKTQRAGLWLPHAERGRVIIVRDEQGRIPAWWDAFRAEMESFPHNKRDQIDAVSGAYKLLKTAVDLFFY